MWFGALQLFGYIGRQSLQADTPCLSAALGAVARSNLWEQAALIEQERKHRHLPASATAAGNLMFAYRGGHSQWTNALGLLADLPCQHVQADAFLANAALATCDGAEEAAQLLVSHIPSLRIQPDIVSFNSALSCCARGSHWRLGEELVAAAQSSQDLDDVSCNSLADAFDKASQWLRASQMLLRMQSC